MRVWRRANGMPVMLGMLVMGFGSAAEATLAPHGQIRLTGADRTDQTDRTDQRQGRCNFMFRRSQLDSLDMSRLPKSSLRPIRPTRH